MYINQDVNRLWELRLIHEIVHLWTSILFHKKLNIKVESKRFLTMVYNIQNHCVCGLCPSSGLLNN
jgi:hypothetical protein